MAGNCPPGAARPGADLDVRPGSQAAQPDAAGAAAGDHAAPTAAGRPVAALPTKDAVTKPLPRNGCYSEAVFSERR